MQSGPSGPPSAGPTGPPPAGPSGPPTPTKPSGPPSGRAKGRPTRGPPQRKQPIDEGAFAKLAEQNEARQREINRREKSVKLKELRNSSRINVVLMLLLVVVFGAVALWPVTYGDISANPHQNTAENVIIDRNDPENPKAWSAGDVALMESKIWDGKGQFSGSFQYDLNLPGLPIAISGVTTVPVTIEVVSYRFDGGDTGFRIGFFDGRCLDSQGLSIENLQVNLRYASEESLRIGEPFEVDFNVPAGSYCVIFEYTDPPFEQGYKATIDAEITTHFLQPLASPVAAIFILMSIFALVGAHKTGKAWKKVAQPEKAERKSTEEQVLEDADEQRGAMSEVPAEPDEETPEQDAAFPPQPEGEVEEEPAAEPAAHDLAQVKIELAELAAIVTGAEPAAEPEAEPAAEPEAEPAAEPAAASTEVEYSDDELRAFGWTDEQIHWHRNPTERYTDEQLEGFGWTAEQIAQYRNQ